MSFITRRPLTHVLTTHSPRLLTTLAQTPTPTLLPRDVYIAQATLIRQQRCRLVTMHPTSTPPEFAIPTINIASYLSDPSSPGCQSVIDAVRNACLTTGFFQITGHGVPKKLRRSIFEAAKTFFALPFAEKKKLDAKMTLGHRGYDVLGTQSYEDGLIPDLKEGFYVGAPLPPTHPLALAKRFFMGPNVYPAALPAATLQEPAERYHATLLALSRSLMRLIARTLPHDPDIFEDFLAPDPAAPLRLLHYPPMPPPPVVGLGDGNSDDGEGRISQFGASPHTDFGAITILLQDTTPGLQVQHPHSPGTWLPVPPREDALVVNVGDMLSMWTGGRYRSSVHRVVSEAGGKERFSVVFFLDGRLDCELGRLGRKEEDGEKVGTTRTGGEGRVLTVEDHMLERMATTYGRGKKVVGEDAAAV